jgi:hypothetical protein
LAPVEQEVREEVQTAQIQEFSQLLHHYGQMEVAVVDHKVLEFRVMLLLVVQEVVALDRFPVVLGHQVKEIMEVMAHNQVQILRHLVLAVAVAVVPLVKMELDQ